MSIGPLMLAEPYTLADVLTRGLRVSDEYGPEVTVFDSNYSFATLRVEDGVAKEVFRGPFHPGET